MNIITVKDAPHLDALKKSGGVILADFWKDNCVNCKMLELSLRKIEETVPGAFEGKVLAKLKLEDVGEALFFASNVRQAPTVIRYDNGVETARNSGFISLEKLKAMLA